MSKSKLVNHIAILLDNSGSMTSIRQSTMNAFNQMLQDLKLNAMKFGQKTTLSFMTFNSVVKLHSLKANINDQTPLVNYWPTGSTALYDAVGEMITRFSEFDDANDPNTSFLLIVITDGCENVSQRFNSVQLSAMIRQQQNTDKWTFTFSVPIGYKRMLIKKLNLHEGNVQEWEQTDAGTLQAWANNSIGTQNYFTSRSQGSRSVDTFYVQTDLSNVSSKDLKKLDDISDKFDSYEVPKEMDIKQFVEAKTRKPYVLGNAFYLLMKKEEIQPKKEILIIEKGKKAVWGGKEARDLVGLPDNAKAKVTPYNHKNFEIYVQSTSVNRKLVRGTKVLIRK